MKTGLVIGKFYPLHLGHIGLIQFAQKQCDQLIVLICVSDKEQISGAIRLEWVQTTFRDSVKVKPIVFNYSEKKLPNTSKSSKEVSKIWASEIARFVGNIDIIFSSEKYGDYVANFLACDHIPYQPERTTHHISANEIRENTFEHWDFIAPAARPYFVKKICIYGSESTGKSTLSQKLAAYFQTSYVPEMAREIVTNTNSCTREDLQQIAQLQSETILKRLQTANKLLIVDTSINTTRSYSKFLFKEDLSVESWMNDANQFHLHLFLDVDAPHIQDGSRLDENRRNALHESHKQELINRGVVFQMIRGNWEERLNTSISIIEDTFL